MSASINNNMMNNSYQYTPVNVHTEDDSPVVVVDDNQTGYFTSSKRKMLLGGALCLWVAIVGVAKTFSGNVPLATIDVLLPDGRHDQTTDTLVEGWLDQTVDHFDDANTDTFKQKYYTFEKFWKGPGHPIFFIL